MNYKLEYTNPVTGLRATSAAIPEPPVELIRNGQGNGRSEDVEAYLKTNSTSNPYSKPMEGAEFNRMWGGPFVPHGALSGQECRLSEDCAISDVDVHVRQWLTPTGLPKIIASGTYLLFDLMPRNEDECRNILNDSTFGAEVVVIDASYDYSVNTGVNTGSNPTVSALTKNHKKGAILQRVGAVGASYNLDTGDFGYGYQLDQPTAVAGVTAADGGSQKINVSFTPTTDAGVQGYMLQVLKKGDAYSLYAAPVAIPEDVLESEYADGGQQPAIFALSSAKLVLSQGSITVSGLNRYYLPSTKTLGAIVAGTYYVVVRAMNQTTIDENLRLSDPTIVASVVVA